MVGAVMAEEAAHVHDLRLVEMVFDDGVAWRVYECPCGMTDAGVAA